MQIRKLIEQHVPMYCLGYCQQMCIGQTISIEFGMSIILTILTIIISIYHVIMHLHNFNNPYFQSKIIVMLIMPPLYSVTVMGAFVYPYYSFYFNIIRGCYQGILVFTFFYLMFSYLAFDRDKNQMDDKKVYKIMASHQKQIPHFCPLNYCYKPYQLTHWKKAKYFTYRCKKYVLQFLIIKFVTTCLMYIIYPKQKVYQMDASSPEIQTSQHETYLFISSLVNWTLGISSSISLQYLELFYIAIRKPLQPYSPQLKFMTIKITLFFTFWQSIVLSLFSDQFLNCFDSSAPNFNGTEIMASLENTLICIQMFIMTFAGGLAYNYQNYVENLVMYLRILLKLFKKILDQLNPRDLDLNKNSPNKFNQNKLIQSPELVPLQKLFSKIDQVE